MIAVARKCELSELKQRLVELMQGINFGWIERLTIHGGEPVFKPAPRVIRDYKFGGENGPRRELEADDFILKKEVTEFFNELDRLGDGRLERIEIKHGLPFRMTVEENAQD